MTKVEELREMVLESIARYGNERYHDGSRVGESWLDALIAAAKEEERERIRQEAVEHGCWSWRQEGKKMIQTVEIRVDVIAPKEANSEQT